jgi:hypothetical protein
MEMGMEQDQLEHVHVLESIHSRVRHQLPRVSRVRVLVSGDFTDAERGGQVAHYPGCFWGRKDTVSLSPGIATPHFAKISMAAKIRLTNKHRIRILRLSQLSG